MLLGRGESVQGGETSRASSIFDARHRDFNSVSTFVFRGHGIGLLPSTYCDEALGSGGLIRLLPKWASSQIPVFTVYSTRKFLPLRLSVFLEALGGLEESAVDQGIKARVSH